MLRKAKLLGLVLSGLMLLGGGRALAGSNVQDQQSSKPTNGKYVNKGKNNGRVNYNNKYRGRYRRANNGTNGRNANNGTNVRNNGNNGNR